MSANLRPAGERIYVSAKVDHISIEAEEWLPLCGKPSKKPYATTFGTVYPGVSLCKRCQSLAEGRDA